MQSVIIGLGEVGDSLYNVISSVYPTYGFDIKQTRGAFIENIDVNVLHICIKYSDTFIQTVKEYQEKFKPQYTVIHSTVAPGTSVQCNAVHSPIIGIHPHLEQAIRTFSKMFSGKDAGAVADYWKGLGLRTYIFDKEETTEVLKPIDTQFYGVCIEYTKEIKRICDQYGIPFEAWSIYNGIYNRGYSDLGYPEYVRPNLVPIMRKIGGHCIVPNLQFVKTAFTDTLNSLNT